MNHFTPKISIALFLALTTSSHAQMALPPVEVAFTESYSSAKLLDFGFDINPEDLSGLILREDPNGNPELWTVNEGKGGFPAVLRLTRRGDTYVSSPAVILPELDGFRSHFQRPGNVHPFDLEGVAQCGAHLYLANERIREIIEIDLSEETIRPLPLNWNSTPVVFAGGRNAGFEGITVDCEKQILYLGKERAPRQIVAVNLKNNQVLKTFDVPASNRFQKQTETLRQYQPNHQVGQDFADLAFDNGYIYALERNSYEIAKIDPTKQEVVGRIYFGDINLQRKESGRSLPLNTLYRTFEYFGLTEGLAVDAKRFVIALDNNHKNLSDEAISELSPPNRKSTLILEIARPEGF